MNAYWRAFRKAAWDDRLPRERQTIALGLLLLLPLLAYFALWQPAHRAVAKLQSTLPVMRAQAGQMKWQAEEAEALRLRPQPALLDATTLKALVEASVAQYQLGGTMERLDLLEPNGVRIAFSAVPYAQWLRWARHLQEEQHVRIDSLDVAALPSPGLVKINVTLVNGPNR